VLARRGRHLQYLTISWNSAECLVALTAGFLAGSVALVGFGFDSAIEVTSSLAALSRLRWDADEVRREAAERFTLRVIGACFLLLAVYVTYDATPATFTVKPSVASIKASITSTKNAVTGQWKVCTVRSTISGHLSVSKRAITATMPKTRFMTVNTTPSSFSMRWAAGFYAIIAGSAGAFLAAIPGAIDWWTVVPPQSSAKNRGLVHGSLNTIILALFIAEAAIRGRGRGDLSDR